MYTRLTIFTDGAARSNPGQASIGVHVVDDSSGSTVAELSQKIGIATNNVAEYRAILSALEWLEASRSQLSDTIHLNFRADSELVVKQLRGEYRVRAAELASLFASVQERLHQLPGTHTFGHIPRSQNKRADRLANDALDR